jgi:hypothetical protein
MQESQEMKLGILLAAAIACCVSCRPQSRTALGSAAEQLHASMYETNVLALFEGFRIQKYEFTLPIGAGGARYPTTFFQTNVNRGTVLKVLPTELGLLSPYEACYVYFDTNGLIAAFDYSRE